MRKLITAGERLNRENAGAAGVNFQKTAVPGRLFRSHRELSPFLHIAKIHESAEYSKHKCVHLCTMRYRFFTQRSISFSPKLLSRSQRHCYVPGTR